MKNIIYDALFKKYESDKANALATLEIYFNNPSGIGEHPGMIEKLATAQGNIDTLEGNYKRTYSK